MGEEKKQDRTAADLVLPLMALRDVVVMPNNSRTLLVGRRSSLAALESAGKYNGRLIFVAQREENKDQPQYEDLYHVGCLSKIISIAQDGEVKRVTVKGIERVRISKIVSRGDHLQECVCELLKQREVPEEREQSKFAKRLLKVFGEVIDGEAERLLEPSYVAKSGFANALDSFVGSLPLPVERQQELLEELSVDKRVRSLLAYRRQEEDILRVESELGEQLRIQNTDHRKDYLRSRAAEIQSELGDGALEDVDDLRRKVEESGMSEEAHEKCLTEISRLGAMTPMSPESSVIRSYLDVLLGLPWKERSEINQDLHKARKVLDSDHKGLGKVKDRIIEYLAVKQQVGHNRGSVLCLLGPPGVGKTSLGMSIARATCRRFVRLALGGIHDEATIRGHRRTYVASMPGRILRAMADAKTRNPVFMLDEIDKLAASANGDPMAALLEVIDPEQNHQFADQYAEVEFDLSEVMFIATANSAETMYPALRDRLEIIELPGYTDSEKYEIARRHLIPKSIESSGVKSSELKFSAPALRSIIHDYTSEAGVRNLERSIAKICRKTVLASDMRDKEKKASPPSLSKARLRELLGAPLAFRVLKRSDSIGIVNGLAVVKDWEGIVHQIDAVRLTGGDGLVKTGNLMPNIEQSIDTACAVLRANPCHYGLAADFLDSHQVHIHYPNIDVSHDGNSNGLALFTLLVSVLTDIPVRIDTAITGAINLRGEACPVGGLREKLVGAWRERIRRVLIPQVQARELAELPSDIANELEIITVKDCDAVLRNLLVRMPKPIKDSGAKDLVASKKNPRVKHLDKTQSGH